MSDNNCIESIPTSMKCNKNVNDYIFIAQCNETFSHKNAQKIGLKTQ